jgi:FixJ family two-component response regulator
MSAPGAAFVVDDDAAMRNALTGFLEIIGLPVRSFDSAQGFLGAYDPEWTGHLFVDLQMTGMNGLELLEELVRRGTHLRLVLITGHGGLESEQLALKTGAFAVLRKPFSTKTLEDALRGS